MQICRLRWRGRSESNTLRRTGRFPPVPKGRILCRSVPGCHRCECLAFGRAGSSAITTSRPEGLTSGLRIAHTTVPLYAVHSRCPRRIGGRWRCRTPRLSPRTVFKTGSEAARIHLPYRLDVLHLAPSDSNRIGLGTRTPLHIQGLPSPYLLRGIVSSPRDKPFHTLALCPIRRLGLRPWPD